MRVISDNDTPNADTLEAMAELDGGGYRFSGFAEALFAQLDIDKGSGDAPK